MNALKKNAEMKSFATKHYTERGLSSPARFRFAEDASPKNKVQAPTKVSLSKALPRNASYYEALVRFLAIARMDKDAGYKEEDVLSYFRYDPDLFIELYRRAEDLERSKAGRLTNALRVTVQLMGVKIQLSEEYQNETDRRRERRLERMKHKLEWTLG